MCIIIIIIIIVALLRFIVIKLLFILSRVSVSFILSREPAIGSYPEAVEFRPFSHALLFEKYKLFVLGA
jgi:hypothetical protein